MPIRTMSIPLVYKGQIQLRQNDSAGAIESLQSALKNDAENATAHYQLGVGLRPAA